MALTPRNQLPYNGPLKICLADRLYLRFAFRLAAQRAFINCERRRRPAAVIPLPFLPFEAAFAPPRPARKRAHLARAAAAILARAPADNRRLPPPPRRAGAAVAVPPPVDPTNPLSRRSNASIWRRIDKACSKFRVDKSIERFR